MMYLNLKFDLLSKIDIKFRTDLGLKLEKVKKEYIFNPFWGGDAIKKKNIYTIFTGIMYFYDSYFAAGSITQINLEKKVFVPRDVLDICIYLF